MDELYWICVKEWCVFQKLIHGHQFPDQIFQHLFSYQNLGGGGEAEIKMRRMRLFLVSLTLSPSTKNHTI